MKVLKFVLAVIVACVLLGVGFFYFNKNIKVSVIVPVYNTEKYLDECLASLEKQILKDMEFIVIDDGSTDNSFKIMQKYAKKDKRFKIYTQKNEGVGKTRNRGISLAKGEYVGFVDSDDYVSRNYFEELYKMAKKYDADVSVVLDVVYLENGVEGRKNRYISKFSKQEYFEDFSFLISDAGEQWDKIYKKSFLDEYEIRSYDKKLWFEDIWFSSLVAIYAKKIAISEKGTYFYRIRDDSLSAFINKSEEDLFFGLDMYKKILEKLKLMNDANDRKNNLMVKLRDKIYTFIAVWADVYNKSDDVKHKVWKYFHEYEKLVH